MELSGEFLDWPPRRRRCAKICASTGEVGTLIQQRASDPVLWAYESCLGPSASGSEPFPKDDSFPRGSTTLRAKCKKQEMTHQHLLSSRSLLVSHTFEREGGVPLRG